MSSTSNLERLIASLRQGWEDAFEEERLSIVEIRMGHDSDIEIVLRMEKQGSPTQESHGNTRDISTEVP